MKIKLITACGCSRIVDSNSAGASFTVPIILARNHFYTMPELMPPGRATVREFTYDKRVPPDIAADCGYAVIYREVVQ